MLSYCLRVALALISSPRFRSEVGYLSIYRSLSPYLHYYALWSRTSYRSIDTHSPLFIEYVLFYCLLAGFACSGEEVRGAPYPRLHQHLSGEAYYLFHSRCYWNWYYCYCQIHFQCYIFLDDPCSTAQLLEKLAKGSKVRSGLALLCTLLYDDPLPTPRTTV